MTVMRGGVYRHTKFGRHFLVVSTAALNTNGAAIVVEVDDEAPSDVRGMFVVRFGADDPLPGAVVLCWRLNWMAAERLGDHRGDVDEATMEAVEMAVRSTMDL